MNRGERWPTVDQTPYGCVQVREDGSAVVNGTGEETGRWARRSGGWPCSSLEGLDIVVHLARNGDVEEIKVRPEREVAGDELDAWIEGCLREARIVVGHRG